MLSDTLLQLDPGLVPFADKINNRISLYQQRLDSINAQYGSIVDFANLHTILGLHKSESEWILREYAPNAVTIYLIGDFCDWKEIDTYKLAKGKDDIWEIRLPLAQLPHSSLFKLKVYWTDGGGERLPAYIKRVIQDDTTKIFSAQVWNPDTPTTVKPLILENATIPLLIYECHIGMGTAEEKVGSFNEFRRNILPRIHALGYNAIQIMALQEHPYYGSFGYHVSSYFALSSRFGTPEDFKQLVTDAHQMGIRVVMDIVHSHAVKNENEGIGNIDGNPSLYFYNDHRREHPAWDSLCFDYSKELVQRFLLSNCRFWIDEYGIDGFRFDGVTSMIYTDHGLNKAFTCYSDYFDGGLDNHAQVYLTLANNLIHHLNPLAITIAEEMSGLPALATNITNGGLGFDYRMAMGIPDYWIKLIKEIPDDQWNIGELYHELTNHRPEEKTISYAESHDQALVGDQTIIFRLISQDMYWFMGIDDKNIIVDRGIALHKIIRLLSASTQNGGYLNFMGNEFGHPEWIDFPRAGNNWSYSHARRLWQLVDNTELKYQFLNKFDQSMIQLLANNNSVQHTITAATCNDIGKVITFQRNDLLFVFNLNPEESYPDYGIIVPAGKYKIILNSDASDHGGFNRIDDNMTYYSRPEAPLSPQHSLHLYLPARTALVLKKTKTKSIHDL